MCGAAINAHFLKIGGDSMKVVYPVCCGVDVHKSFLVATIITTTKGIQPHYKKKRFSTYNRQLREFAAWLKENECTELCMESTGKYWIPVYNILEAEGIHITVANPKWVKAVKGNKDDVKDSKWIGELFRLGLVPGSFIPEKPIRILREFTRYRTKLKSIAGSEKNRFQNAFTVCNVALDSVVNDMFGVSATKITNYLMTTSSYDPAYCASLIHYKMKDKTEAVLASIDGYLIEPEQKYRMKIIRKHLEQMDTLIERLDKKIDSMVKKYEVQIALLTSIPGIQRHTAITILSEIGVNMERFSSSKKLCCWAGLTPGNNESAGKKKSVRITKAGTYLKPALVEAAHAAVKCNKQSYYKRKFECISKRRGKKRAYVAIARMLLTAVYHILSAGVMWSPTDLERTENAVINMDSSVKRAITLLERKGYAVSQIENAT